MPSDITQSSQNCSVAEVPISYSPELLAAIESEKSHHDASSMPYLSRSVVAEARRVAAAMETRYLSPLPPADLRDFLVVLHDTLNAVVCNPTDSDTLSVRVGAACTVLAEIPRRVFRDEFTKACLTRFKFLPAPAELLTVAEELAQLWRNKTAQVRLLVTRDEGKRFTLGYAPPVDDGEPTPPQDHSGDVRDVMAGVSQSFKSRRAQA